VRNGKVWKEGLEGDGIGREVKVSRRERRNGIGMEKERKERRSGRS